MTEQEEHDAGLQEPVGPGSQGEPRTIDRAGAEEDDLGHAPPPPHPRYSYHPYHPPPPYGWGHGPRHREPKIPTLAGPLLVFVLLMVFWMGALVLLYTDVGESEEEHHSDLRIEDDAVFLQLEDVDILEEDEVQIDIIIFTTNYGEGDSGDIRFNVYAQNKTNDIIETRANTTISGIPAGETVETQLSVRLPTNESFRIKIHLLEDNMIVRRGEGQVSLKHISQSVVDFTTEGGSGNSKGSEEDSLDAGGVSFIGLGAACFIGLAAIAAIIYFSFAGKPPREQRPAGEEHDRRLPK